ncbi:MAG: hypothetical protein A2268_14815 [Candidatus Raymondbacteria bacterium RifOxyA12_full_50_37]|uniref:Ferrous iron transporter FeoA-like domain-containing protein n=1 Tax=Candidatus Raymondbacteria bacterium RIFOXYD12_FULL_49_13 TaxID=1817890 RepID=A0A1F7F2S7_UNCRA|nr:MAG: hypothetical protein A2268_14815 [Candidatus Raymondbacteria bacterium RifOxyA12_full_50_37]OGJ87836.1 MAG: hypothetical protein A2350_12760 [Candidatus Raymondbacteria bacterium RifOxyB12_full_50_8]OGJ88690.1 MAG: hypothetical protein A2248_20750 [Candidatus Raymondbacteria bacterium RIFOXYA2_FULL_49_16]OGK00862.1 MAG: hypothetical protein A2519_08005 [Candidatus Raymondbacteria bacterium RIFOXYD12_FULL_49_13]OGP41727.1 MAG: hypothetical protein A2324_07840 [Candidatus Raymondbacteria 
MEKSSHAKQTGTTNLVNLDKDHPARIIEIQGGHGLRERLNAMGLAIGSVIVKKNSFYGQGPVVIKSGQTTVALGHGMAEKVIVELIGPS